MENSRSRRAAERRAKREQKKEARGNVQIGPDTGNSGQGGCDGDGGGIVLPSKQLTFKTKPDIAPGQLELPGHEACEEFKDELFGPPAAEASSTHWANLSMLLSGQSPKAKSEQEDFFLRLLYRGRGRALCPMCPASFRRAHLLFAHLDENHPIRLDRLCSEHFDLFDRPLLAVSFYCRDCQILRIDTMLTAGLVETAPQLRFAPLFMRHRAVSLDEGTTDMHRRKLLVTQPTRSHPGGSEVSSEIDYDDQFRFLLVQHQLGAGFDAMAESLADYLEIDGDLDVMHNDDEYSGEADEC
jgi:hypothetical protein